MKILYLNSFSAVQGGAERLLFDTCLELLQRGHRVSLVAANDDRRVKSPEWWPACINKYYVPELIVPLGNRRSYDRHRRSRSYLETLDYLQDIITLESPDLIHVHNFPSLEFFKNLNVGVPLVRTVHSYENLCANQMKRLPDGSICPHPMGKECAIHCGRQRGFRELRVGRENSFLKLRFARFIAISNYIHDVLIDNGYPEHKIRVLPNFTRMAQNSFNAPEENRVLFVGRLTPEKGLLELIRAISRLKSKPILTVVGGGGVLGQYNYQDSVLREAASLGVSLELQPWIAGDELGRAYARAKVVAFSSLWPEPFGLVGIEAMMQGKPVVAFDVGGVRDWLQDGQTGFLAPPIDLDAYADRIDRLLEKDSLRRQMGEAGRAYALKNFSAQRYLNDLLAVYDETLQENAGKSVVEAASGLKIPCRRSAPENRQSCSAPGSAP